MKKEEQLLRELDQRGILLDTPNHEIEEWLGIRFDDFDDRKRRYGYPASKFYKDFSTKQANKKTLLVDRLFRVKLGGWLVFWRLAFPGKILFAMLVFLTINIASAVFWLYYVFNADFYGSHYSFIIFLGSACIVWLLNKNKFVTKNPVDDYVTRRNKRYEHLEALEPQNRNLKTTRRLWHRP